MMHRLQSHEQVGLVACAEPQYEQDGRNSDQRQESRKNAKEQNNENDQSFHCLKAAVNEFFIEPRRYDVLFVFHNDPPLL